MRNHSSTSFSLRLPPELKECTLLQECSTIVKRGRRNWTMWTNFPKRIWIHLTGTFSRPRRKITSENNSKIRLSETPKVPLLPCIRAPSFSQTSSRQEAFSAEKGTPKALYLSSISFCNEDLSGGFPWSADSSKTSITVRSSRYRFQKALSVLVIVSGSGFCLWISLSKGSVFSFSAIDLWMCCMTVTAADQPIGITCEAM